MECPYCKKEMVVGFVSSSSIIIWSQTKSIIGLTDGEIDLPGSNFWRMSNIPSWYCEICEKVIIDTK